MPVILCDEILEQGVGETVTHALDFTNWLRKPVGWNEGDACAATLSTLTSILDTATVLTLTGKSILASDTVPRDQPDKLILTSHGVKVTVAGGVAGKTYVLEVKAIDSDSNTWTLYAKLTIVGTPT